MLLGMKNTNAAGIFTPSGVWLFSTMQHNVRSVADTVEFSMMPGCLVAWLPGCLVAWLLVMLVQTDLLATYSCSARLD